ncbi:TRAP transporter small permease [Saliterribacillus persicus]|uniref:TRAP-type C4-dicarboxylate transport system permease small subunit n=1 Tax=Saliterribacillus persicus TaxID=930114 RepID=A0A368XS04_9BACI|nr:TRAP transporter small permease [Saliterribacillus persicus]RCW69828.1 TRAP-type C4-dicarboxylate transport system permease small subunit [Saliterribacillus persicus]
MQKILGTFDKIEKTIVALGIFLTSVIIFVNVVLRYFFDSGFVWAEEAVRYIIIYIVMLGSSLAITKNEHIAVTLLETSNVKWFAHLVYGIQNIASLAFTVIITVLGIEIVESLHSTSQISPAMQIPMWWVYLVFPLSSLMMSVRLIVNIIQWMRTHQIPTQGGEVE